MNCGNCIQFKRIHGTKKVPFKICSGYCGINADKFDSGIENSIHIKFAHQECDMLNRGVYISESDEEYAIPMFVYGIEELKL